MSVPGRGHADYFAPGDWNIACSMCGRKLKFSEAVRNWQGLYRHTYCNEARQPQDFARGIKDVMTVPFAQPETDKFIGICTLAGISAVPYYAMPGCSIPGMGLIFGFIDPNANQVVETEAGSEVESESGEIVYTEP